MTDRILECVRDGNQVCAVFYGHPGIFVDPSHKSIRIARKEGFKARMLPAVSSLDCLFCDLGIDPSSGCQMFEATDLLLRQRSLDVYSHTILWQVAATGDLGFSFKGYDCKYVPIVVEYLSRLYPLNHSVTIYEAAQYSVCEPGIHQTTLGELSNERITGISTLYLPPLEKPLLHLQMLERLGLKDILKGKRLIPVRSNSVPI